jgi:uroporphyrinogen decarboxylase
MDKVLAVNMRIVQRAIRAGAEVIILGDDYAANNGPLFSPAIFRDLVKPRLAKMVAMIHDEGAMVIKHSDGNIYPILEDIVETGPDGINPVEPVAGMDLKTVKRLVGDRVCITGNIDCAHLLPHGTPEEVRDSVRQAIGDAGEGGGYIVTSSNSIHSSCRPENLVAMVKAVHEFGAYDMATAK